MLVNVPVGDAKPGETAPRRNYKAASKALKRPEDSKATTIYDFFTECVGKYGDRNAMGYRNLIDIHSEVKKVTKIVDNKETQVDKEWLYYEYSTYKYISYTNLLNTVQNYGKGLLELGINHSDTDRIHIFAATSAKWMQTYLAATSQAIPIVTAYDTLGEAGLTHSIKQTGSVAVFTDNNLISNLIIPLTKTDSIKYIIHAEPISADDKRLGGKLYKDALAAKEKILENNPDIKFISYDEVVALGKKSSETVHEPSATQLCCIMYTSGSTGDPKGVVLTHENVLAGIGGVSLIADHKVVTPKDRIIAFLPLAHIFEMVFELISFWWGGCLGYANVKTLTDASVKNCQSDLKEFKPTIMVGVAAVWETVRKGILAQIKKSPAVVQKVFWLAYNSKLVMKNYHIPGSSVIDSLIFKKVKQATGGSLHTLLNGGSPLSEDTQVFISNLIAPMLIGYGLTETCANCTVLDPNHFEYSTAGALTGAVTVKLIDVPEANYLAKNNQGEILIIGAPVTTEYYQNEKETADTIKDGWFHTGDIGEWTSNGQLRVIDRRKNLVKTANGEYIALEKLESIYRSNTFVVNICCYADQYHVKPIAIIIPNEELVRNAAKSLGITSTAADEIYRNPKVAAEVTKSLIQTGKQQGLNGIELLQGVVLLDEEWTPQNGFVTSAQKLQRKKILDSCKDRVDSLYK